MHPVAVCKVFTSLRFLTSGLNIHNRGVAGNIDKQLLLLCCYYCLGGRESGRIDGVAGADVEEENSILKMDLGI